MKTQFKLVILAMNLMLGQLCFSQVTHFGNNQAAGDLVGYDGILGTPNPLDIRNDFVGCGTCNIDFYIDNNHFLQVLTGGDLNVVQPANAYMIDGEPVLWHNNLPDNIYVGVSPNRVNITGHPNTLIGWNAGDGITGGAANTIVGNNAGLILGGSGGNTM